MLPQKQQHLLAAAHTNEFTATCPQCHPSARPNTPAVELAGKVLHAILGAAARLAITSVIALLPIQNAPAGTAVGQPRADVCFWGLQEHRGTISSSLCCSNAPALTCHTGKCGATG